MVLRFCWDVMVIVFQCATENDNKLGKGDFLTRYETKILLVTGKKRCQPFSASCPILDKSRSKSRNIENINSKSCAYVGLSNGDSFSTNYSCPQTTF